MTIWSKLRERAGCHEPEGLSLWQWPKPNEQVGTCRYCHRGIVHDGNGGWYLWKGQRNG